MDVEWEDREGEVWGHPLSFFRPFLFSGITIMIISPPCSPIVVSFFSVHAVRVGILICMYRVL